MDDDPVISSAHRAEMLHIYKIASESVERVSDRRQAANSFYLTFVSALLAAFFASYTDEAIPELARTITCIIGLSVGLAWLYSILGFRTHNSIKFKVVEEIESQLPFAFYQTEDRFFDKLKYKWRFTTVELGFPVGTLFAFAALLASAL